VKPASRFLGTLALALAMLAPFAALATPSANYLVRHGEKAPGDARDPELTEMGRLRARNIAAIAIRRACWLRKPAIHAEDVFTIAALPKPLQVNQLHSDPSNPAPALP
jgi:hypothetical protein